MMIESHDASVDIIGSEPEKWKPETRETADHSLPYITAIALIDGEVTDKQFQAERFKDPKVWKFLENVKVERNAELSAIIRSVANIVHMDLADGRTDQARRLSARPRHESAERFSSGRKILGACPSASWEDRAKKILDLVWKLDEAKNVDELMQARERCEEEK